MERPPRCNRLGIFEAGSSGGTDFCVRGFVWWTALPLALVPAVASAQAPSPEQSAPPAASDPQPANPRRPRPMKSSNSAPSQVTYDSQADVVTASGAVRMERDGNYVAADQVVWNRKTGEVRALGNVVVMNPQGDKFIGDNVVLTDTLRDGTVDNLLSCWRAAGASRPIAGSEPATSRSSRTRSIRPARSRPRPAARATRAGRSRPLGSPTTRTAQRVRFRGGRMQIFGVTLPLLPIFSLAHRRRGRRHQRFPGSRHQPFGQQRLRSRPALLPPARARTATSRSRRTSTRSCFRRSKREYRELNRIGAFQVGGFLTYGRIERLTELGEPEETGEKGIRAYFEANGKSQLDPLWSITGSTRIATRQDGHPPLRHHAATTACAASINAERISPNSYISIAGWAFQGLRVDDVQKQIPIALPAIDARFRLDPPIARRHARASGEQPGDPAHRGAGHAARLRQRAMGPAAADATGARS